VDPVAYTDRFQLFIVGGVTAHNKIAPLPCQPYPLLVRPPPVPRSATISPIAGHTHLLFYKAIRLHRFRSTVRNINLLTGHKGPQIRRCNHQRN
jgi:hypothetical protein